jgi:starch phosphorylase
MGLWLEISIRIFKQEIHNGYQVKIPDYWLDFNPWEFPRHDVAVDIQFYGQVTTYTDDNGKKVTSWEGGELVTANAYDVPIPGYLTPTTNNLRMWSSKAHSGEFDFAKFNSGEYEAPVADQQRAETISAVLCPNDSVDRGKELRLKQQYFWCAASLYDLVRRFKKTNHTVLSEALEKWNVPLVQNLLPHHLQIIYDVNLFFLQSVERRFPKDRDMLARVSVIEEAQPKMVRMAFLAIIGSHKVNGVAELHSDLIKTTIFKDFVEIYGPDKFTKRIQDWQN